MPARKPPCRRDRQAVQARPRALGAPRAETDRFERWNDEVPYLLVERQSRYVMLVRLPNKETQTVIRALGRRIRRLPEGLMQSLTCDRGSELAAHRAYTIATNIQVCFCDPQSPWQRGSNENTNGLLRQYLPHATDLSSYSQAHLDRSRCA